MNYTIKELNEVFDIMLHKFAEDELIIFEPNWIKLSQKSKMLANVITKYKLKEDIKISLKQGIVVVLEEKMQEKQDFNRDSYEIKKIENSTYVRFKLREKTRGLNEKDTLHSLHPQDPCLEFENKGYYRRQYRDRLYNILSRIDTLTKDSRIKPALEYNLEEVKTCS